MSTSAWSTQQLAEFLAGVSVAESEPSAALAAVERAAETLDADVAAIVRGDEVLAAVGYAEGRAPAAELQAVKPGLSGGCLDVPGLGLCAAMAALLDYPPGARLVIARPATQGLTRAEAGLLRGMAQVASMTMRMLHALDDERSARVDVERLAGDQAALRRVATLVAKGAPADDIYTAVAGEIARRLGADVVAVLRYHADDTATLAGGSGAGVRVPIGARLAVEGQGAAVSVLRTHRPAHVSRFEGPPGSVAACLLGLGVRSGVGTPIFVEDELWGVAIAASTRPEALPVGTETRIAEFTELLATAIGNAEARAELRRIADEQAALRRVATLVARGEAPSTVFEAVAEEVGHVVPATDVTLVGRYHSRESAIEFVGGWSRDGQPSFVGKRVSLGGQNVATLVFEGRKPARRDYLPDEAVPATALARGWARSAAGAPINVEGRLWGAMTVGSLEPHGLPAGIEHELADFTELVATAIANAEAREELRRVADEQAALRRVATLVARAAPPAEVFAAVAHEMGQLFDAAAGLVRYDPERMATVVGGWTRDGPGLGIGTQLPLGGRNTATLVFESGRAVRIESYRTDDPSPATTLARESGGHSGVGAPISVAGRLWGVAIVIMPQEERPPADTEERLAEFAELVAMAIANAEARDELRRVADEQAALRRVATRVAQGAAPLEVFRAVTQEVGSVLAADAAIIVRLDPDGLATVVARVGNHPAEMSERSRWVLEPPLALGTVLRTGRPARQDDYRDVTGAFADVLNKMRIRSSIATPIVVQGRLWGALGIGNSREQFPADTEPRMVDFTELVAAAIANAEAQAELTASRARVVASADETRRRIERNLHDGAQQRLVTLALRLRIARAAVPPEHDQLAAELDRVAAGLNDALDELRELARGIHPPILAERGLRPALKMLARRSAVPVEVDVRTEGRLPDAVEVGAYYVVSEALTNAAKHAHATTVTVDVDIDVEAGNRVLHVCVSDDGVGGADFARGSGLVGLRDRVEALGGRIALESKLGLGTSLSVDLPIPD